MMTSFIVQKGGLSRDDIRSRRGEGVKMEIFG